MDSATMLVYALRNNLKLYVFVYARRKTQDLYAHLL